MSSSDVFRGCMPALMTPCFPDRSVSLAAATGKLIAELVSGRSPHIDPVALSPQRFV